MFSVLICIISNVILCHCVCHFMSLSFVRMFSKARHDSSSSFTKLFPIASPLKTRIKRCFQKHCFRLPFTTMFLKALFTGYLDICMLFNDSMLTLLSCIAFYFPVFSTWQLLENIYYYVYPTPTFVWYITFCHIVFINYLLKKHQNSLFVKAFNSRNYKILTLG